MKITLFVLTLLPLSAGDAPGEGRAAASAAARRGDWRGAEYHQQQALSACGRCGAEDRFVLRAELAGYLVLGGFPEAAIPIWRRSLLELPEESPSREIAEIGLGVALYAAGRLAEASGPWSRACGAARTASPKDAACRFNLAVSRMEVIDAWPELETILPILQKSSGPITRTTALLQTARAALLAGKLSRADDLLNQADLLIVTELNARHPFRAMVYETRALLADKKGERKAGKAWRRKAAAVPQRGEWERATVSMDELKGKAR